MAVIVFGSTGAKKSMFALLVRRNGSQEGFVQTQKGSWSGLSLQSISHKHKPPDQKVPCHAETKNDLNREMGGPEQQYAHISVLQVGSWLTDRPYV